MRISAISFDADQTLWDFAGVYQQALAAIVDAMIDRGDATADQVDASVYMNRTGADPHFRSQARYEVRDLIELEALMFTL